MKDVNKFKRASSNFWKSAGSFFNLLPSSDKEKIQTIFDAYSRVAYLSEYSIVEANAAQYFSISRGTLHVKGLEYNVDYDPENVKELSSPTNVAITGPAGATTYAYKITALNDQGETLPSIFVSKGSLTTPVNISWGAVEGATSYKVYGRTASSFQYIATTTTNSFQDTGAIAPTAETPPTTNTALSSIRVELPDNFYLIYIASITTQSGYVLLEGRDFTVSGGKALVIDLNSLPFKFDPNRGRRVERITITEALGLSSRLVDFYIKAFGKPEESLFDVISNKKYTPTTPEYALADAKTKAEAYGVHINNWAWAYSNTLRNKPTLSNIRKGYYLSQGLPFSYNTSVVSRLPLNATAPSYINNSSSYTYRAGILTERGPNIPRLYTCPEDGQFLGQECFEAYDNLISSYNLSTAAVNNVTVSTENITGPTNTLGSVFKVTDTSATGQHYVEASSFAATNDAIYNFSIFVKEGSSRSISFSYLNKAGVETDAGTLSFDGLRTTGILSKQVVGNGWVRIFFNLGAGTGASNLIVRAYNESGATYAGTDSLAFRLWGPQLTEGTRLKNYTAGAKNGDICTGSISNVADTYSLVATFSCDYTEASSVERTIAVLSDNVDSVKLSLKGDVVTFTDQFGNTLAGSVTGPIRDVTALVTVDSNTISLYVDEELAGTLEVNSTLVPTTCYVGVNSAGGEHLNGYVKRLNVNSEQLTTENQLTYANSLWALVTSEQGAVSYPLDNYIEMEDGNSFWIGNEASSISLSQAVSRHEPLITSGITYHDYISNQSLIEANSTVEEEERLVTVLQNTTSIGAPDPDIAKKFKSLAIPAGITVKEV